MFSKDINEGISMQQILDNEYIDMYNITPDNFWVALEHIGRYEYAKWFVNKRNYENVLDIACSNGFGCEKLGETAKSVVGVDIDKKLLEQARKRHVDKANISYMRIDIDNESLSTRMAEKKFCVVTCFETIEHIEYPERFLTELKDILKRDGRILISIPAAEFESVDEKGNVKNPHHKHLFDEERIEKLIEKSRLEVEFVLGQSMVNLLMRQHNAYCSRNPGKEGNTTSNFLVTPEAMDYYIKMFAYPIKDDIENSYSRIYVLKHRK